jgi:hypothetical protein
VSGADADAPFDDRDRRTHRRFGIDEVLYLRAVMPAPSAQNEGPGPWSGAS